MARRPKTDLAADGRRGEPLLALAEIARIATQDLELRPMLQRITDTLSRRFGWELVALVGLDHERSVFVCEAVTSCLPTVVRPGYSRPFGSGVVGEVAATGETVLIDDATTHPGFVETAESIRSELCAPIRHRGEVVAVLNLESPRLAAFSGVLPLVEAIADEIAGAIASARLYEATRQRALHFEVLSEVSRAAVSGGDLKSVLQSVASYLRGRFDLLRVAIVVPDAEGKRWSYRAFASREPLAARPRQRWPVPAGVVGRAVRLGQSQLVPDVAADPEFRALSTPLSPKVMAELVVPIRQGARVVGALDLEHDTATVFDPATCHLLELVADQIAGAIRMVLLNEQLAGTKQQLQAANRNLQRANRSLERLSQFDPLTGVANRRHFETTLALEWRRASRSRRPLALLLIDVDHFKAYNDAAGHPAGDRCLERVAEALLAGAGRAGDLAARYGGEEFAVVLPATDLEGALASATVIRRFLAAAAIPHPGITSATGAAPSPCVTLSIGAAAVVPGAKSSPEALIAAADEALYRAKQHGRDRVELGEVLAGAHVVRGSP